MAILHMDGDAPTRPGLGARPVNLQNFMRPGHFLSVDKVWLLELSP